MAFSKTFSTADVLELVVHYEYYGNERCTPLDIGVADLLNLGEYGLTAFIGSKIQYIGRMSCVRLCFRNEENSWVDLNETSFPRLLRHARRSSTSDVATLHIRVVDGASPYEKKCFRNDATSDRRVGDIGDSSRRGLSYEKPVPKRARQDGNYDDSFVYKSPMEVDIDLKTAEMNAKKVEYEEYVKRYEYLKGKLTPTIPADKRKRICSNCHQRGTGHHRGNCPNTLCQSAVQCGELDMNGIETNSKNSRVSRR